MISVAITNLTFKDGVCFAPCKYGDNVASIEWENPDNPHPTDAEIETEITRLQTEYDAQQYARNRATEYPTITDQLDEIYHNGIDSWKAVIKITKDKYPKG